MNIVFVTLKFLLYLNILSIGTVFAVGKERSTLKPRTKEGQPYQKRLNQEQLQSSFENTVEKKYGYVDQQS